MADKWKEGLARLVAWRPFNLLMVGAIQLIVPRQRVGVALVGFNDKEEILLLRHVYHGAIPWGLPGGWLGRHEAPSDGVTRECREETNLQAILGPVVHINRVRWPDCIVITYLAWLRAGSIRLSHEIIEARWFDPADPPVKLHAATHEAIAAAVEQYRLLPDPRLDRKNRENTVTIRETPLT